MHRMIAQREEIALETRRALEAQMAEKRAKDAAAKAAADEARLSLKEKAEAHNRELERQREAEHLQRMAYKRVLDKQREYVHAACARGCIPFLALPAPT